MGGGGDAALPWVIVPREEDGEENILLTLEDDYPREALLKAIPELLRSGGELWTPCYDWLPVSPSLSSPTTAPPFLFKLATCSDIIHLPSLQTLPNCNRSAIRLFLLSSPPTDPECRVFLVHTVNERDMNPYSEIAYCKPGDQLWTVHDIREDLNRFYPRDYRAPKLLWSLCVFQGKLYAEVSAFSGHMLVISVDSEANRLELSPLKVSKSSPVLVRTHSWMGESMGELLHVDASLYGAPSQTYSIRVFKLDFSKKEWVRMRSLNDRTLFLNQTGSTFSSCPSAAKPRIRAWDDIFFIQPEDQRLHSFNLEEDSFSVYLPGNTLTSPSHSPTVDMCMPLPRSRDTDESYTNKNMQEAIKDKHGKRAEGCVVNWEALLDDCFFSIAKCLDIIDYGSFRVACKKFRNAAPPVPWTVGSSTLAGRILLPWFMFIKDNNDICNLIDPVRGDEFQVMMPNILFERRIVGSKNGILLMQLKEGQICWVNPFTGHIGRYPSTWFSYMIGIEFSTEPTCSSCVTVAVTTHDIYYINQGEGKWYRVPIFNFITQGNPVFLDGHFYFIGVDGELAIFDNNNAAGGYPFRVLERSENPCNSFEQCFLARCDGQLLAVFVSHIGNWIRVFKLDHSTMTWIEVESLKNHSLFINHSWCFSTTPKLPGMENKIFLSRYHGEKQNMVFYSLETKGFHYLDGCTDLMKSLCGSCQRTNSCWIEPNWT